jgi:hypothetical protein
MLLSEYNEAEAMELFREDGRTEGRAESVVGVMAKLGIAAEQALEALNIHGDERELVIKLLAEHF